MNNKISLGKGKANTTEFGIEDQKSTDNVISEASSRGVYLVHPTVPTLILRNQTEQFSLNFFYCFIAWLFMKNY